MFASLDRQLSHVEPGGIQSFIKALSYKDFRYPRHDVFENGEGMAH
jgi:hypothetical protein